MCEHSLAYVCSVCATRREHSLAYVCSVCATRRVHFHAWCLLRVCNKTLWTLSCLMSAPCVQQDVYTFMPHVCFVCATRRCEHSHASCLLRVCNKTLWTLSCLMSAWSVQQDVVNTLLPHVCLVCATRRCEHSPASCLLGVCNKTLSTLSCLLFEKLLSCRAALQRTLQTLLIVTLTNPLTYFTTNTETHILVFGWKMFTFCLRKKIFCFYLMFGRIFLLPI